MSALLLPCRAPNRVQDYRLPKGEEARLALALSIGADGTTLLHAIYAADAPSWLIMVGGEIALSTTTPKPDMIVSHHPAFQCMVTCD